MTSNSGSQAYGSVNFEQMPNSVIVTFRLEGLAPKTFYHLFLHPDQYCDSLDMNSILPMTRLRANENGIAENTFKLQNIKVSGAASLMGDVVLLRTSPKSKDQMPSEIACGAIFPQTVEKASFQGEIDL